MYRVQIIKERNGKKRAMTLSITEKSSKDPSVMWALWMHVLKSFVKAEKKDGTG